jgi:hypothetical protein
MNDMSEIPAAQVTNISQADLAEAVRSTALLADLTISMWSAERTDPKLGAKLKEDAGAVGNTGRYVKNLLAGCDASFKAVRAAYAAARAAHYTLTLPWNTNPSAERASGPRLLPNLLFDRYLTEMSKLRNIAVLKRDEFVAEYPALVVAAQANLAGLANASDYPTASEVEAAFRLSFDFLPIPSRTGFTGFPDAVLEKLGASLVRKQEAALAASQVAMWDRVKETIEHLVLRLDDKDGRFKYTTIEAVRELLTLLPGFDVAGDARVTTVVADISAMLSGVDAESIRKDQGTRQAVIAQARAISDKLGKWGL